MAIAQLVRTLLDDWHSRLERATAGPWHTEQSRVLQFLIRRYRDTDIAQRPALFPARQEVFLNTRAIVVHHALTGMGGAHSERAGSVLGRISERNPQGSTSTPAEGSMLQGANVTGSGTLVRHPLFPKLFERAYRRRLFAFTSRAKLEWKLDRVAAALEKVTLLPEDVVKFLALNTQDSRAIELLARCRNSSAVAWAVDSWRENRNAAGLETFFLTLHHAAASLQMIREELANPNAEIRCRAIATIEKIGTVQDVGLLLDLMNLPAQADDLPDERQRLLQAAQALSERGK